ncbi:MAG: DUF2797 domain-containing protein, partial [Cyclobacteriaceae bacterium]|nr:DUF2797 domain-containing protein [Cyclobacteriaceae bacterium]
MRIEPDKPVHYFLKLGGNEIFMNALVGQKISIRYKGIIHCIVCGRRIKKIYGEGFCYPCFISSPLNSECILRPELCLAHEGKGRDAAWEDENHNKPHIIYLAQTSDIKVGVTRTTQIPTRWLDQGAWKAVKIALTPYRYLAGMIEIFLKKQLIDKTPWQRMLKNEINENHDLYEVREKVISSLTSAFSPYILPLENEIFTFEYPVIKYPEEVKSINLDKCPLIAGILAGIRGQYLIFED